MKRVRYFFLATGLLLLLGFGVVSAREELGLSFMLSKEPALEYTPARQEGIAAAASLLYPQEEIALAGNEEGVDATFFLGEARAEEGADTRFALFLQFLEEGRRLVDLDTRATLAESPTPPGKVDEILEAISTTYQRGEEMLFVLRREQQEYADKEASALEQANAESNRFYAAFRQGDAAEAEAAHKAFLFAKKTYVDLHAETAILTEMVTSLERLLQDLATKHNLIEANRKELLCDL